MQNGERIIGIMGFYVKPEFRFQGIGGQLASGIENEIMKQWFLYTEYPAVITTMKATDIVRKNCKVIKSRDVFLERVGEAA